MERFHRYYALHRILTSRRLPVRRAALERELECTRATVMRVIEELRNYGAPVEYLREANGYRYTPGKAFELPGIWFSPSELEALLVAQNWLERAEPGLHVPRARGHRAGMWGFVWSIGGEVLLPTSPLSP